MMVGEFQFVAVLIAIIFGLSLTHVMSSTARIILLPQGAGVRDLRLIWTAFVVLILLLNWWVTFQWRTIEHWSFDLFLVLIIWAASHYALAITLYPFSGMGNEVEMQSWRSEPLLVAFIILACLDMAQTAVRNDLFSSPYYLPFTLQYIVLAVIAMKVKTQRFYLFTAWYFVITFFTWAMVVRRFLA